MKEVDKWKNQDLFNRVLHNQYQEMVKRLDNIDYILSMDQLTIWLLMLNVFMLLMKVRRDAGTGRSSKTKNE